MQIFIIGCTLLGDPSPSSVRTYFVDAPFITTCVTSTKILLPNLFSHFNSVPQMELFLQKDEVPLKSRTVLRNRSEVNNATHHHWLEHVQLEMTVRTANGNGHVVSHHLGSHHRNGFALCRVHFSWKRNFKKSIDHPKRTF